MRFKGSAIVWVLAIALTGCQSTEPFTKIANDVSQSFGQLTSSLSDALKPVDQSTSGEAAAKAKAEGQGSVVVEAPMQVAPERPGTSVSTDALNSDPTLAAAPVAKVVNAEVPGAWKERWGYLGRYIGHAWVNEKNQTVLHLRVKDQERELRLELHGPATIYLERMDVEIRKGAARDTYHLTFLNTGAFVDDDAVVRFNELGEMEYVGTAPNGHEIRLSDDIAIYKGRVSNSLDLRNNSPYVAARYAFPDGGIHRVGTPEYDQKILEYSPPAAMFRAWASLSGKTLVGPSELLRVETENDNTSLIITRMTPAEKLIGKYHMRQNGSDLEFVEIPGGDQGVFSSGEGYIVQDPGVIRIRRVKPVSYNFSLLPLGDRVNLYGHSEVATGYDVSMRGMYKPVTAELLELASVNYDKRQAKYQQELAAQREEERRSAEASRRQAQMIVGAMQTFSSTLNTEMAKSANQQQNFQRQLDRSIKTGSDQHHRHLQQEAERKEQFRLRAQRLAGTKSQNASQVANAAGALAGTRANSSTPAEQMKPDAQAAEKTHQEEQRAQQAQRAEQKRLEDEQAKQKADKKKEEERKLAEQRHQQRLQAHLNLERSNIRLAAGMCGGKSAILGSRPAVPRSQHVANCIAVHYEARCPGQPSGRRGVMSHLAVGSGSCYGEYREVEPFACEVKQVQVRVTDVTLCSQAGG